MTIRLATTSDDKLSEVQRILKRPIVRYDIEFVEPQEVELETVVRAKAQQAYDRLRSPVIVEDSGLFVNSWNGLPGALVRWFLQRVGPEGICSMLQQFPSREATAQTLVAYHDGQIRTFRGVVAGQVPNSPRGENGFGFDSIFVPAGSNRTYAEMDPAEKDHYSMRRRAFEALMADEEIVRRMG